MSSDGAAPEWVSATLKHAIRPANTPANATNRHTENANTAQNMNNPSAASAQPITRYSPGNHTAVLAAVLAAAEAIESPSPTATTISHRSVLTENANLHALNRRLSQRVRDLEDKLSEVLGQQAFECSGLGAPTATAALRRTRAPQTTRARPQQPYRGTRRGTGRPREANRGLMAELNWP